MSYSLKKGADVVKEQFALYYPAAMEWVAEHVEDIHHYTIMFPNDSHDVDHGSLCKFAIDIYFTNGRKVILDSSYGFSTDCEVGEYYSEPTLKWFNNWTGFVFGEGTHNIPIGVANVETYVELLNKSKDR